MDLLNQLTRFGCQTMMAPASLWIALAGAPPPLASGGVSRACRREMGMGRCEGSTAWPVGSAGRSPGARGGNAIVQLPRLSKELFELLHGGSRIRNVAMGARRENPYHP